MANVYRPRPSAAGIRKRGRPVTYTDVTRIDWCLLQLPLAVRELRKAGAHHAATRVRAALKSTQGALNHARAMLARQERAK